MSQVWANIFFHNFHISFIMIGAEGDKRIKPPEISLIFIVVVRFWRVDLCGLEGDVPLWKVVQIEAEI